MTSGSSRLVTIGAGLSFACAVHCVVEPVLLAAMPLVGGSLLADAGTDGMVLGIAATLASANVGWGFRTHRRIGVVVVLAGALALLLGSRLGQGRGSEAAGVIGAVGLGVSQIMSRRLGRSCAHGIGVHQGHL